MLPIRPKKRLPKTETRENLVQTTLSLLDEQGLDGVKARNIAEGAGVALGTIYNMFEDLDGLIMEANSRTFAALADVIEAAETEMGEKDLNPQDTMVGFAEAYMDFVLANSNRWQATLAYASSMSERPPAWYVERQDNLFARLEAQLSRIDGLDDVEAMARGLWSAVHGIVSVNYRTPMLPEPKPIMMKYAEMVIRSVARA